VSYRVWELRQQEERNSRTSIASFVCRNRFWKEGYTDNDKKLGLTIQYLDEMDRRQCFEELKMMISVGNTVLSLVPSLDQFANKFGWNSLGVESDLCSYYRKSELDAPIMPSAKRLRLELDEFLTVEEACRHFFDTRSLEEAIWDLFGIPRIVILNGNREKMEQAGWISCGINSDLGDKSVQLGHRVAHAYFETCEVWKERGAGGIESA